MKIAYKETNFKPQRLDLINRINLIVDEYKAKGYELTLRQVYYQLVARDIIENNERSYKNVGNLISDGRLAGLIDWEAIIDRTRQLRQNNHWANAAQIVRACANQFQYDKWDGQDYYVEVWVEKDALIGIVERTCNKLDVPFFSCRGYVSQSEMWEAAQRLRRMHHLGREGVIIHLGDHDPSGKDMSRDIAERLETFEAYPIFERIALNIDQIHKYNPPPNPTKVTDSRAKEYIKQFGYKCWELDALKPEILDKLISEKVAAYCNKEQFDSMTQKEKDTKAVLMNVSNDWETIRKKYSK